jgi:hypothetical protein
VQLASKTVLAEYEAAIREAAARTAACSADAPPRSGGGLSQDEFAVGGADRDGRERRRAVGDLYGKVVVAQPRVQCPGLGRDLEPRNPVQEQELGTLRPDDRSGTNPTVPSPRAG